MSGVVVSTILEDTRAIQRIVFAGGGFKEVGSSVDEIIAYEESVRVQYGIWYAIIKNDVIIERINGEFVAEIKY
jgi:hypothetical protein